MQNESELRSILTSWGVIRLEITSGGLSSCTLPRLKDIPRDSFSVLEAGTDPYSCYVRELLEGRNPPVPSIAKPEGTPFQLKVWQGLRAVPRGATCSYSGLAEAIGHPSSARAVANACGRNPAPLFIPCHRVIRADGTPGGFSSGAAWKRLLLAVEQME